MTTHGCSKMRPDLLSPLVEPGNPAVWIEWKPPVPALLDPCLRGPSERPARFELSHAPEERLWSRDEARGQELRQHRLVKRRAEAADRQNGFDLGGEQQLPVGDGVVQRLD